MICQICGEDANECQCPECPEHYCGGIKGNYRCYDLGHLKPADDSVKAFCDHIGIYPISDALRAIEKHNVEHVWLVLRAPHPRTGKTRIYYHDQVSLDFLPEWMRLRAVGVGGIAWDGSDWEWSQETEAGGDWSQLDELREAFHEALTEHNAYDSNQT